MKKVVTLALALVGLYLASCNKEGVSATDIKLPVQTSSAQLSLLQNKWLSSESVMIPDYGDSSYGWFGNYVFPVSLSFGKDGTATMYNSIDLTDDQWYDSCAYRLLADSTTLLFYPIAGGIPATKADTATIGTINDSTLVLYFWGTKTASVPDAFHR